MNKPTNPMDYFTEKQATLAFEEVKERIEIAGEILLPLQKRESIIEEELLSVLDGIKALAKGQEYTQLYYGCYGLVFKSQIEQVAENPFNLKFFGWSDSEIHEIEMDVFRDINIDMSEELFNRIKKLGYLVEDIPPNSSNNGYVRILWGECKKIYMKENCLL